MKKNAKDDSRSRTRVMVVDDDQDVRLTIQDILQDEGFSVVCAANGREALDALKNDPSPPSLILLDLMMPEMDGWAFRREQQSIPRLASIPVVLFSADRDVQKSAVSLHASAHIEKPLRLEGIATLVEQLAELGKPN